MVDNYLSDRVNLPPIAVVCKRGMGVTNEVEPATNSGAGTLYLVPLPIGNPRDITFRAVDTLRAVALIAAEDTRDFRHIQREYDIDRPVVSYHDHNERSRAHELVTRLLAGGDIALVSDAGTPLISDPGFRIVAAAIAAGVTVSSLPGPCAAVAALAASGLPVNAFHFLGFPPRTSSPRQAFFRAAHSITATLIYYEAPHRLSASLADAEAALGDRIACLARNLTKPHEHFQRGSLSRLIAELRQECEVRGEVTVLIAGAEEGAVDLSRQAEASDEARRLIADGVETRAVVEHLTTRLGLKRREAYDLVLRARAAAADES
jgi:16S rRNA (cytidine1402-2'-O)-methyltransferase